MKSLTAIIIFIMLSHKIGADPVYTIWFAGGMREGTAWELLDGIRREAAERSETIAGLTTEQYASSIVSDASFFLAKDLLAFFRKQEYQSEYDRALRYLSEMPSAGVRILSQS